MSRNKRRGIHPGLQRLVESQREMGLGKKEEEVVAEIPVTKEPVAEKDHDAPTEVAPVTAEKPKPAPEPPSKLEEQARRYLEQAGNEKAAADELRSVLRSIDRIMLDVRTYPMDHGMRVGMNEIELLLAKSRGKFQS
jgi:hypothetical protein